MDNEYYKDELRGILSLIDLAEEVSSSSGTLQNEADRHYSAAVLQFGIGVVLAVVLVFVGIGNEFSETPSPLQLLVVLAGLFVAVFGIAMARQSFRRYRYYRERFEVEARILTELIVAINDVRDNTDVKLNFFDNLEIKMKLRRLGMNSGY